MQHGNIIGIISDLESGAVSINYDMYLRMPKRFIEAWSIYKRFMKEHADE